MSPIFRRFAPRLTCIAFAAAAALAACSGGAKLTPIAGSGSAGDHPQNRRPLNEMSSLIAVNAGGAAAGVYIADAYYSGGTTQSYSATVDTTHIDDPAPQAVYQSERDGNFTYTATGLTPGGMYNIRLHFDEQHYTAAGQRVFDVDINGTRVLSNFDIFMVAGAQNVAFTTMFRVYADAGGKMTITFTSVVNQAKVNGIELGVLDNLTGAPLDIAAGNDAAVGSFAPDDDYNGGLPFYNGQNPIDTSGVTNPPPVAVYANERYGKAFSYQFNGLQPGSAYTLRLDFNEPVWTGPGERLFNVGLNGNQVLTNYDIFADAGARFKATAKSFTVNADPSGHITAIFTSVLHNAVVNGLELAPAAPASPPPFHSKIQHVVVIIQENRSFDDLFNGFPGADTVQSGINSKGQIVPLQHVPFEEVHDPGHAHKQFEIAYDHGRNDAFDIEGYDDSPSTQPNYQYAFVPFRETADYYALARAYALGDRMFASNSGPSYPAHQYLIAGQSAMVAEIPSQRPWGCDAPSGTYTVLLNAQGKEVLGPFPCFNYQTLGDLMDAKGVSWAYYAPAYQANGYGYQWSAYDPVQQIRFGRDWNNDVISPETTILSDIANNNLRQVSYVAPDFKNSDHSISGSNTGPAWVSSIIDAIGSSPYWSSTAVIVTWDDWGGWYDHVVPPQLDVMGLGFRVPILVVSPYVKHGYVSHVQHEHASIVKFIEEVYGLPSLGQTDVRADDLADFFDLSQQVQPFRMLRTKAQSQANITRFIREVPSNRVPDDE